MICEDLGIKSFAPLWYMDEEKMLEEMVDFGFEFLITQICADRDFQFAPILGCSSCFFREKTDVLSLIEQPFPKKRVALNPDCWLSSNFYVLARAFLSNLTNKRLVGRPMSYH